VGNDYLAGNYAPVQREGTITDLAVTGTIPAHLDGRYLRNGPNPIAEVDPAAYHWFTGDGMIHGIRLRDGKAEWYRNRWIRSPAVAHALGEVAPRRVPIRAGLEFLGANTNVIGHAGRTLALIESGITSHELTETLDTVGPCDFDGTLRGGYTAHPKRDPDTGELHAVSYSFGRGNRVQYSVIGVDGRVRRTVDIEVTGSPMMHDFSLTEQHVIFYDLPVTLDSREAVAVSVPRVLRAPARLVLSALIGRVRVPDPIIAMAGAECAGTRTCPTGGTPATRLAWVSCRAPVALTMSAGSMSSPASSSILSTPTTTATRSCWTSCGTRGCSRLIATDPTRVRPPWTAGSSIWPTARSGRPGSTTTHRNSPASTSGSPAGHTATGMRCRPVLVGAMPAPRCSNTTCAAV
jgi:hypothetical protein